MAHPTAFTIHSTSVAPAAPVRVSGTAQPGGRDHSRTLAGMLLAAVVAALLVVADQLIETWADGHLLVVWVALWSVAFAGLALLAPPLRRLADVGGVALDRWSKARAQRRSDHAIWQIAQQDHRLMQELYAARLHSENA